MVGILLLTVVVTDASPAKVHVEISNGQKGDCQPSPYIPTIIKKDNAFQIMCVSGEGVQLTGVPGPGTFKTSDKLTLRITMQGNLPGRPLGTVLDEETTAGKCSVTVTKLDEKTAEFSAKCADMGNEKLGATVTFSFP